MIPTYLKTLQTRALDDSSETQIEDEAKFAEALCRIGPELVALWEAALVWKQTPSSMETVNNDDDLVEVIEALNDAAHTRLKHMEKANV